MGAEEFDAYYQAWYGQRWKGLKKALLEPSAAYEYRTGLLKPYLLDYASVLAAGSLRLPEQGLILDCCAAPGGKSLVIASAMGSETELLSNELSNDRRRRLVNVLDEHLPPEIRGRVRVSGFDAAAQGGRKSEHERFSAVLLDAPCSSERHVLGDEQALSAWSAARPRFLAQRQWALLSSAFLLLKSGGSLVYATCAVSPEENDRVVSRLVKKYGNRIDPDIPDMPMGEQTEFGRMILPDRSDNMGPMYIARFRKKLPDF
ncbi:16S rRNA methyltransferase [Treponema sp. OttesenSCG-928-L16]|nr:16S rRNA methyltransferase [Treponema sp. OttesenSCG-928-L16]